MDAGSLSACMKMNTNSKQLNGFYNVIQTLIIINAHRLSRAL